ncbi:MAG: insulinase family protein, partial [Bdellovibrionales bacterium]|nr:insulinase family protein [Bdellovibrionales bacterium]
MTFFISKTRQLLMLGIVLLSAWCTPALAAPTIGVVQGSLERIGQHVEKIVLSNGLRVIVFHRPQAPVFAGQVWVRVGGVDEIPGSTGISHMLEHMAFKGTNVVGTTDSKREAELLERLEKRIKELESPALSSKDEQVHQIQTELSKLWEEDEFTHL